MDRDIFEDLVKWKDSKKRKPLMLQGVRQCGKTFILKEFGKRFFPDTAYFTFERNQELADVFEQNLDPERILKALSAIHGSKIREDTLIIFDEIQFCKGAITSLKYFYEEAPQYHIACAGSLLGVALSKDEKKRGNGEEKKLSFPVGKVNMMMMFPLSFKEFLGAMGKNTLVEYTKENNESELPEAILSELINLYLEYLCVGGMPEAVDSWVEDGDMAEVERIHREILNSYARDFAKHAPKEMVSKINSIWDSIPMQLSKNSKRFIFGHAVDGARGADLKDAVQWLVDAGLVHRVEALSGVSLPLKSNADPSEYKLYYCDVGLLRTAADLPSSAILLPNEQYTMFKGSMAENYVLNELKSGGFENVYFWTSGAKAEVDFVVQVELDIVPIEVKSEERIRAASLKEYVDKYAPRKAFLISKKNLKNGPVTHLPLPLTWMFRTIVERK